MPLSMLWPLALVVVSNVLYQLCTKSVPKGMNAFASLTVTYLVGAVCSAVMFFALERDGSLLAEYKKCNLAPVLLGISVVGLEVGYIFAYKNGWSVSTASLVQSAVLAVILVFVGAAVYQEALTPGKLIGIALCLTGLYFLTR